MATSKIVTFAGTGAAERAQALFDAAKAAGNEIVTHTLADARETSLRLREAAELPTLPPGVGDVFTRLADKIDADLLTARAIMERP